jgi:hypothetical protein
MLVCDGLKRWRAVTDEAAPSCNLAKLCTKSRDQGDWTAVRLKKLHAERIAADSAHRQERLEASQREIVGRDALIRCEKSGAPSAACAASLICERRRSSSNGSVVSIRPEK